MKTAGRIALIVVAVAGGCSAKAPYTSKPGNYRVDMPGTPKEIDRKIPSPLGGDLEMHGAMASDSANVAYSVLYCDYPEGIARSERLDAVLDAVASGFIRGSGFTELETKKSTLYGYPGRELSFQANSPSGAKGLGRSRIFLAGNRLFQVVIVGPEANATAEVAKAYFDSFALLEKAKPNVAEAADLHVPLGHPPLTPTTPGSPSPAAKFELAGWGTLVDPKNDCQAQVAGDALTITVPGTLHDFNPPPSNFDAPRMLKDVNGDFTADVQVPEEPRPGGKSVGAGLPYHGAGLVVFIDDANFARLERAGILRGNDVTSYALFEGRSAGQRFGRDGFMPAGGTWLRLQRKGGTISAFAGTDGKTWSPPLATANVSWPDTVKVGAMAVNSADRAYTARFQGLKITQP